ncbi:MAG: PfkB family carbohydrate kinase [Bacteroidota bacterium]|nr:PfkB family carbohydrate kinase [Bacteroidota bacterium]
MIDFPSIPTIKYDLTVVGDAYVELAAIEGQLHEAKTFERRLGGSAAHVAVFANMLGSSTTCIAALGADALGTFVQNTLRSKGVNVSGLQFSREHPTTLLLSARTGKLIQTTWYRSADWQLQNTKEHISLAQASRIVYASGFSLWKHPARHSVFEILRLTKKTNNITVLHPAYEPAIWRDRNDAATTIKKTLQFSDIATPTIDDAEHLFGKVPAEDLVRNYHDFGVETVILFMGREGCLLSRHGSMESVPAIPAQAVDPAGVHEAWHAGLFFAMNAEKELATAVRFANAVAAWVLQQPGSLVDIPDADTISRDLLKRPFDDV